MAEVMDTGRGDAHPITSGDSIQYQLPQNSAPELLLKAMPAETFSLTQPTIDVLDLVTLLGFIKGAIETGNLTLEGRTVIHEGSGRIESIIGEHGERGYVVWPR